MNSFQVPTDYVRLIYVRITEGYIQFRTKGIMEMKDMALLIQKRVKNRFKSQVMTKALKIILTIFFKMQLQYCL